MEEIARLDEVYIVHVGGRPAYYSHYLPACQKLARELHAKTGNVTIKRKSGSQYSGNGLTREVFRKYRGDTTIRTPVSRVRKIFKDDVRSHKGSTLRQVD